MQDDDLTHLAAHGLPELPAMSRSGHVDHAGARIWYATFGHGRPVVLLHGGLGHGGNWAHQIPALVAAGWSPVVIDTRGHGRSTLGPHPLGYELLAADLRAVLDALDIAAAPIIGWSDGAVTGLLAARDTPDRVARLFFFACNVDASGTKPFAMTPVIERIFQLHQREHAALSPEPGGFDRLLATTEQMQQTQPNLSAADLAAITVPVTVAIGENDEFIERAHMDYLAATLPRARLRILEAGSHFAPLQRPHVFNAAVLRFLAE